MQQWSGSTVMGSASGTQIRQLPGHTVEWACVDTLMDPWLASVLHLSRRYASCQAYSFAFAALHQLRQSKAGVGVRLAAEAVTFRDHAERLGIEYDRLAISGGPAASKKGKKTPAAAGRRAFQEDLDKEVGVRVLSPSNPPW